MTKAKPKLFAWDFHGTLEQGTEVGFAEILRRLAKDIKYKVKIDLEEVRKLYGISVLDYLKHFFPKIANEELVNLRLKIRTAQNRRDIAKHTRAAPYAREVLVKIKEVGHKNIVVSTSSKAHINWFLKTVGLFRHLDAIFAIDRHALDIKFDIAKEKAEAIKKYAQENQVSVGNIVVIGDRPGDIDAGRLIGAKTYQYINPDFPHIKTNADVKITDLREILGET